MAFFEGAIEYLAQLVRSLINTKNHRKNTKGEIFKSEYSLDCVNISRSLLNVYHIRPPP